MPLPIIPIAAAAIGTSLASKFGDHISSYVFNDPEKRATQYASNLKLPNLLPSPTDIMGLYHAGYIPDRDSLKIALRFQGIDISGVGFLKSTKDLWRSFVSKSRTKPSPEMVIELLNRGLITKAEADGLIHENGWSSKWERDLLLKMTNPLPVTLIYELYWRGEIRKDTAKQLLRENGYRDDFVQGWLLDRTPALNLADVRDLRNRGFLDDREYKQHLARMGITHAPDVEAVDYLRGYLPGPSDLIRFAVKDVLLPDFPGRKEMLEELKEQPGLMELMAAQGIREVSVYDKDGNERKYNIPELYWLASFERPSPTQVYEMLHRLRPNRVNRYVLGREGGRIVVPEPVGIDLVRFLLKDKDYDPIWRDRLAAIAYRPLGRHDVKRLYRDGIYGTPEGKAGFRLDPAGNHVAIKPAEKELYEAMLDFGYSPIDAGNQAYWVALDYDNTRGGRSRGKTASLLCRSFKAGVIDEVELYQRLRNAGFPQVEAAAMRDNCKLEHATALVETVIKATRKAYISGRIDYRQALDKLVTTGLLRERAVQLIDVWDAESMATTREATAAQLCEWVGAGILTRREMEDRLSRMGWKDEDVRRISRHCVLGHLAKMGREQERIAREQARQQERIRREFEKLQKRIESEARRTESEMRRRGEKALQKVQQGRSPSLLKKYFARGVITIPEIRAALLGQGWLAADVERWIVTELPPKQKKEN